MKSVKYLEEVKAKHSLVNDRQLALHLKKSTGTISQYMNGSRVMDDEMCLAVALDLGIDPLQIIGAACIDRAEKTGQKSLFEVFMMRAGQTASAALALVLTVNLILTQIDGNPHVTSAFTTVDFILCQIAQVFILLGIASILAKFASSFRTIARSYAR